MIDIYSLVPDTFLQAEMRKGYEVSSNMKAVWLKQLELLLLFDEVCRKYDLTYSIIAGTLLGAVRHDGYIPWDDDIDVLLKREDYEKLCTVAEAEFNNPFFFQTEYTDAGSFRLHAQLRNSNTTAIIKSETKYGFRFNQGIFIDIFPLDYLSNNKIIKKIDNAILHVLWGIGFYTSTYTTRYNSKGKNAKKRALHYALSLINVNSTFEKKACRIFEKYLGRHKKGKDVYIYALHSDRFTWKAEWFEEFYEHKFEFLNVIIPKHYDEILKKSYGDWHKMVKGASVHGNTIYDVNKPYKEYIERCEW